MIPATLVPRVMTAALRVSRIISGIGHPCLIAKPGFPKVPEQVGAVAEVVRAVRALRLVCPGLLA